MAFDKFNRLYYRCRCVVFGITTLNLSMIQARHSHNHEPQQRPDK